MSDNPLSSKVSIDTTNFKAGVTELNTKIRVIESGFKAAAAGIGDWDKSSDGLELRIKSLTGTIGLQQQKVDGLQKVYQEMASSGKASAKELDLLSITINKETERLNNMQGELKGSQTALDGMGQESKTAAGKVDDLGKKEETTSSSTDKLKNKSGGLGTALKTVGTMAVGLAVAVAAIGVGIGKMVLGTAKAADDLDELSQKTGISTDRLQELQFIAGQSGTDFETMTGSMARLVRSMSSASDQTGKASAALNNLKMGDKAESFYALGVAVTDSSGAFRDGNTVYKEMVKAISEIKNPVERDVAAMSIFGKAANQISLKDMPALVRSMDTAAGQFEDYNSKAADLQSTSAPVAEAFKKLGISVTDSGGKLRDSKVIWEEAIAALGKIPDETERDAVSMAIFGKSAQELNPLILAGKDGMADMAKQAHDLGAVMSKEDILNAAELNDQLDGLKKGLQGTVMQVSMAFLPAFSSIATVAGGYLKTFAGIVKGSDGDLKKMTTGTAGLVKTIITDIAGQAPKLLEGGLSIVQGIIQAVVQSLPVLLPAVITMLMTLVQFIVENIPMILEAGIQILLALITGITGALPQLIPAVVQIIPQIINTLIANLPLIIQASLQLIIALAQGLIAALPVLIPRIPEIIKAIFDAVIQALPMIAQAALELIKTLVMGLIDNLPMIGEAVGQIINTILTGIGALISSLWEAGKSIVEGIWQGIVGQAEYFRKQLEEFLGGIIDGVKNFLGIHSPSAVFAGIGQNMAKGLGAGFGDQFKQIERSISGAVRDMQIGDVNIGRMSNPGVSAAATSISSVYQITIQGAPEREIDMRKMARYVVEEIKKRQG